MACVSIDAFYQGEDIYFAITAEDAKGSAINIDNLNDLIVFIISNNRKNIYARYNKAGSGVYTALNRETAYKYSGWIDSSITSTMPKGNVYIEIKLESPQSKLSDNEQDSIGSALLVEIKNSLIKSA